MKVCCAKEEKRCRDCESYLIVISNPPCSTCVNKSKFTSMGAKSDKNKLKPKEPKYKPYEVGKCYQEVDAPLTKLKCIGFTGQCDNIGCFDTGRCNTGRTIFEYPDGNVKKFCGKGSYASNDNGQYLCEWIDEPEHDFDEFFTSVINKWAEIFQVLAVANNVTILAKYASTEYAVTSILGEKTTIDIGSNNCVFCKKFDNCFECPICKFTEQPECNGTAWYEIQHDLNTNEISDALKHVTTFVEFLRTLHLGG